MNTANPVLDEDEQCHLAEALLAFWHTYAGLRPTKVTTAASAEAVAIWLENVLAPAEVVLASTREGRATLREWGASITEQAIPQLQQLVEATLHGRARLIEAHMDIASRTVHMLIVKG